MHHSRVAALAAVMAAAVAPAGAAVVNIPPGYMTSTGMQAPIGTFLLDQNGQFVGNAANPLVVSGGTGGGASGGSGGAVTQSTGATSWANSWLMQIGTSSGANASGNPLFAQITNLPATQTTAPASFAPGACSSNTVGTTATKIIDSVAAGVPRNGGGFQLASGAAVPIVYSWLAGTNLTPTTAGAFILYPGGTIGFAGAPNTALYAIVQSGSASVSGGCMTE